MDAQPTYRFGRFTLNSLAVACRTVRPISISGRSHSKSYVSSSACRSPDVQGRAGGGSLANVTVVRRFTRPLHSRYPHAAQGSGEQFVKTVPRRGYMFVALSAQMKLPVTGRRADGPLVRHGFDRSKFQQPTEIGLRRATRMTLPLTYRFQVQQRSLDRRSEVASVNRPAPAP